MLKVESLNTRNRFKMGNIFSNPVRNIKPNLQYQYNLMQDTVSFTGKENTEIFSCKDNKKLAQEVSNQSDIPFKDSVSKKFKNGETYVKLNDDVEDKNVVVINAGNDPVNDNLMEFRQMLDAAKRGGAEKITAVLPYLPYSRQDRLSADGESLAGKMIAKDLETAGADKVITFDIHSIQTQGFYDVPMKNVSAMPLFADYFKEKTNGKTDNFVVVSPDVGGVKRAKNLAKELDVDTAIIHKERAEHNKAEAVALIGEVKDKNCILIDDMIDTAGTITEAVKMLKGKGAKDVYICATHGIFSGNAFENIKNCPVKEVVVTDTLPLPENAPEKIKQISVAPLLAEEINK
ncbi:MAG: ribose-phosphate pyrophosphokinase [Candidatus Gastranaerophilales bacterium]|nr:ribose-phosphate pyrophosphokinase [Candidatus Gastranaerophilales bacterium]